MSIAKRTSAINRVENGYVFTEHQRSYNPSKTFTVGRFLQEAKACLASIAITKQCQFLAAGCDFLYVRSSVDRTRKATAKLLVCRTLQGLETMEGNAVGPFQSVFRRCNPDAQLSCFDTFGREWQAKSLRGECCWLRSIESKKNQYIYIYLRAIAHAADPLWESKVGVAFGMVNLDTHGPTKNQNDCFNQAAVDGQKAVTQPAEHMRKKVSCRCHAKP